jgi:hypothetical protein
MSPSEEEAADFPTPSSDPEGWGPDSSGHGEGYSYAYDGTGYEPTEEDVEEALNHLEETAMELGPEAAAEEAFPDNPEARHEFLCAEENCGELLIASNDCLSGHGEVASCMQCGGSILMGGAGSLEEGLSCFEGEDPACPVDCQDSIVGAVQCVFSHCGGPTGGYGPPEGSYAYHDDHYEYGPPESHGYGPPEGSYAYGYEPSEEEFEEALNHLEETAMELGPEAAAEEAFPDDPVAREVFLCAEENCGELLMRSSGCMTEHNKVASCMQCGGSILMAGSLEEGLSCFEGEDPACPVDCQGDIVGAVECVSSNCGGPTGDYGPPESHGYVPPEGSYAYGDDEYGYEPSEEDGSYAYLKIA